MWNLVAITALVAAASADVSATRLDGTTVAGRLETWQPDRLVLATDEGADTIATDDLIRVRLALPAGHDGGRQPRLATTGGSVIPLEQLTTGGDTARLTARLPSASAAEVRLPRAQVRAVLLQPLDARLASQWREIRALDVPHDLLVVFQRDGQSLDYLEGIVGDISTETVAFTLDETTVEVPRAKVAGVTYYRASGEPDQAPPCVVAGEDGLRLVARSVALQGNDLHVHTTDGVELTWPLEQIASADYSADKVVLLGDLSPAVEPWQPLIRGPAAAASLSEFGQPRVDRSATGGALSLWYPDEDFANGAGQVRTFDRGLAVRSRTELKYRLPRGYRRFATVAGIEPTTRATGNVALSIFGDDQLLIEALITGHDAPLPIELDVRGVRRLRIVVDYGENLDTGDWLNLCNARIVK